MRLTRRGRYLLVATAFVVAAPARARAEALFDEPTAGTLMRLFTDSQHILVRSLMGDCALKLPLGSSEVTLHWNNERITIPAVAAPAGSADAVDAITTASRPIAGNAFQDFVKTRNEFQGAMNRGPTTIEAYVSSEDDYLARQLGATYARDLNAQLNLALGTSYSWDAIAPLDDDDTNAGDHTKTTWHWNSVATEVLSPTTIVRFGLEYNIVDGLQHNPYRNVYAGGTHVPERHPDHRERRDAFLKLNQYLSNRSSLKLHYRFYDDDWGILSHEIGPTLSQYVTDGASMRAQYRYYTQSAASFYRAEYATTNGVDGYRTGDYRMAPLASHLFGVGLRFDLDAMGVEHPVFGPLELWMSYERYFNSNNYSANIVETGLDYRF